MRAENAGSAPERAGCGGLRGTVSASAAVSDACGALRLTEKRVPMKLLFKQRFFSWFDSYDIYNEAGDTVYVVKGQLSWGHCLKIFDSLGNELGTVRERVLTFLPQFELYLGERYIGCIRKAFAFFRPKYDIDCNGWHVEGDFLGWDYQIRNAAGQEVAVVSKELFNWTDTYSIDVYNPQDALYALMLVLTIDAEKCSRN